MKNFCLNLCTSSWCQVAVATVTPNICGPSHLSLLHVLPSPRILRLSLDVWEVCATLEYGVRYVVLTAVSAKLMVVCDMTPCGVAVTGLSD